jgi:succinate dehydrogenase / fumarate reductase membrane anchor subunit
MSDPKDLQIDIMRSELSRARGLGAAKSGVHHWTAERVTSVALVPLTLWFIYSLLSLGHASHEAVLAWASGPITLVLMITLVGMTFYHMQLGLQVVLEDYVRHDANKLILIYLMKGAAILLAIASIVAILKIGL